MLSVSTAQMKQDFSEWNSRASKELVEILEDGIVTSYLVPADVFNILTSGFRVSLPIGELSDSVVESMRKGPEKASDSYELDDLPEIDEGMRI